MKIIQASDIICKVTKKFVFFLAVSILLTTVSSADLQSKLARLASTSEGRVGIAFIDLNTGREMSINGSQEFPAASVIKVPIMAAAYHLSESGKINLKQKVLFRKSDKLGGAGVLQWARTPNYYTLWKLIRLMIVFSDNTATRLVVEHIGREKINSYLQSIGLARTAVVDPTMLKEPPSPCVNMTTPTDIAHLMAKIYKAEGFTPQSRKEMLAFMRNQRYRWGIWRGVPSGTVVADKTGNLDGILNDAGIIYTKKGNYILSVFTWGFKKQRRARLLINGISRTAYEEYTGEKVIEKKITKRRLRRRPSAKYRQRPGRRGSVSGRKLRSSPRR